MPRKATRVKPPLYTLHISLAGSDPEIWRRFTAPGHITYHVLHEIIQIVMGWENCHLYQFMFGKTILMQDPQPAGPYFNKKLEELDSTDLCLMDYIKRKGRKFRYEYDFGDSWLHDCKVEALDEMPDTGTGIACLDGACACPPEDCGGIGGYYEMLKAIHDKNDPDHDHYLEWLGSDFDPGQFDLQALNKFLKRIKLK